MADMVDGGAFFAGEMKITLFARKSRKRGGRERMI